MRLLRKPNGGKGAAIGRDPHCRGRDRGDPGRRHGVRPGRGAGADRADPAAVADVVFGSRLSGGRPQRAYLFWHLVGNRFLSLLTGVLFNTTLSDMETGYKAFRRDVLG